MINYLLAFFQEITDYRVQGRTKYPIQHIVAIVFVGVAAGMTTWKDIRNFCVSYLFCLKEVIPGLEAIPSVDTLSRTISNIDPAEVCQALVKTAKEFLSRFKNRRPGRPKKNALPDLIHIDGKSLRGAVAPGETKTKFHIVNAVYGFVTLAYKRVPDKTNEIKAIPLLLEALHKEGLLERAVVTMDAMGCQKSIVERIINSKAHYLISLKGNQSKLSSDVASVFEKGLTQNSDEFISETYASPTDKVAGRIERRVATLVRLSSETIFEWLPSARDWAGLSTVTRVQRFFEPANGKGEPTCDVRYFVSSLNLSARRTLEITVKHWQVETTHRLLDDDNVFGEDKCRTRRGNSPEILSAMRKLALNLLAPLNKISREIGKGVESFRVILKCLQQCPQYFQAVLTLKPTKIGPARKWIKRMGEGLVAKNVPLDGDFTSLPKKF